MALANGSPQHVATAGAVPSEGIRAVVHAGFEDFGGLDGRGAIAAASAGAHGKEDGHCETRCPDEPHRALVHHAENQSLQV
jgi:hypothetical protein